MTINTVRMTAANLASGTRTGVASGRPYSCAVGSVIDVPEFDASTLAAQGFLSLGISGTTAQRPAYPPNANSDPRIAKVPTNLDYVDTTLGAAITFNGSVWVNAATGAVV